MINVHFLAVNGGSEELSENHSAFDEVESSGTFNISDL